MSRLADVLSDHGECIANADDRMDSEIVAELVRQRLSLLSEKDRDTICCVCGEIFQKQMTAQEYAEKHGITTSAVYSRIKKAKYFLLTPGTKLMRHLMKDDYYIALMNGYKEKRKKYVAYASKRKHYKYQKPEYKPHESISRPSVTIVTPSDPQPNPIYPRKPLSDFEKRQQEIQLRYEMEREKYLRELMNEGGFRVQPTPNLNDPSLKHFYEVLADLRRNGGRK